jgi:hypothetical protein
MGGDRQNIKSQAHARAASLFRNSSTPTLYLKALRPSMAITGTSSLYSGSHSGWRSMSISSNSKAARRRAGQHLFGLLAQAAARARVKSHSDHSQ